MMAFSLNPSSSLSLFRPKPPTHHSSSPSCIRIMKQQSSMKVFHPLPLPLPRKLVILHSFACRPTLQFKCFSRRQSTEQIEQVNEVYEFERLFSNLNEATLKREPGSLSSAIFLVAGTTLGAWILAIPAVTQEAGFLASAVIRILCWIFMLVEHIHSLCPPCCLRSSFIGYFGKLPRHLCMAYCNLVFTATWRNLLPWQRLIGAVNGVLVFSIIASLLLW